MSKYYKTGFVNALIVPLVVGLVAAVSFAGATIYFYGKYSDAHNNLQAHVDEAVEQAREDQKADDDKAFVEKAKLPLRDYTTPANLGSIKISFPKNWSNYIELSATGGNNPFNFYANPDYVPAQTQDTRYALRAQLLSATYARTLQPYNSKIKQGKIKATPITLNTVVGTRLDGEIDNKMDGAMVLLPLRSQTLVIWTESKDFVNDFNKNILPNVVFSP